MLAKLHVLLPFELTVPDGAEFRLYGFESEGCGVRFEVPTRSAEKAPATEQVTLDAKPAFQADVLTITFQKDSFNRNNTSDDPPELFIKSILDYFIGRLRYAAQAPQVKSPDFPRCRWVLEYLNDDGSELAADPDKKMFRRKFGVTHSVSFVACKSDLWDYIFSLPADFEPPAWRTLLLDSRAALPHVGTAVVLAATALEVFIAKLLDALVKDTAVPKDLWDWINDRDNDHNKQPSVVEQFDTLLMVMTGHSLKDEDALWQAFQKLRNARNKFVHEGIPKIGKTLALTEMETLLLIGQAEAIVAKIREWIPEKNRWPIYTSKTEIQITMPLLQQSKDAPTQVSGTFPGTS
jgi:hypothetical protein